MNKGERRGEHGIPTCRLAPGPQEYDDNTLSGWGRGVRFGAGGGGCTCVKCGKRVPGAPKKTGKTSQNKGFSLVLHPLYTPPPPLKLLHR